MQDPDVPEFKKLTNRDRKKNPIVIAEDAVQNSREQQSVGVPQYAFLEVVACGMSDHTTQCIM